MIARHLPVRLLSRQVLPVLLAGLVWSGAAWAGGQKEEALAVIKEVYLKNLITQTEHNCMSSF